MANPFDDINDPDKKSSIDLSAERQRRERALRDPDYAARLEFGSSAEQSAGRQAGERALRDPDFARRMKFGSSAEQSQLRQANERAFIDVGYSGAVPDIFSAKPTTAGYTGAVPNAYTDPRERALQTLDSMSAIAPESPREQSLRTLDEMGGFTGEAPVIPDLQAPDLVQRIPAEAPIKGGYTPEERARVTASNVEAERQKLISDFGSRTSAREQIKSLEEQGVSREEIIKAIGTGTSDQQTVKNLARLQRDKVEERSGGNRGRMITRLESRADRNESSAVARDIMRFMGSPSIDPSSDKKTSDYLTKSQQKRLENYYNSASHKKPSASDQKNAERLVKLATDNMNKEMAANEFERKEEVRQERLKTQRSLAESRLTAAEYKTMAKEFSALEKKLKVETDLGSRGDQNVVDTLQGQVDTFWDGADAVNNNEAVMGRDEFIADFTKEQGIPPTEQQMASFKGRLWR